MTPDMLTRPEAVHYSRWQHMSRRERAFAVWLVLQAGWRNIDLTIAASYDTDTDRVLVEFVPGDSRSAATFALCRWGGDESLAAIEAKFGADARRRAEEAIG